MFNTLNHIKYNVGENGKFNKGVTLFNLNSRFGHFWFNFWPFLDLFDLIFGIILVDYASAKMDNTQ